jgi:predicted transposase YdaD
MDKPYDNGAKRLLALCAQDFFDWLLAGALFTGTSSEAFQSLTIQADAMQEALLNDRPIIVHFEMQSGPDPDMAQRLLEYHVLAYRRYQRPVTSYVIYLRKGGALPHSPLIRSMPDGQEILRFHYQVMALWDLESEDLLELGLRGLYPLVPFTRGGARRERVEEIIRRLVPGHDTITRELLAVTGLFASLAFTEQEDQEWLWRRMLMLDDMLRETPLYQYILQRGLQEGREKGMEEGREKGLKQGREEGREEGRRERLASLRQKLLTLVHVRYPNLESLARVRAVELDEPGELEDVLLKVALAQSSQEAEQYLLASNDNAQ